MELKFRAWDKEEKRMIVHEQDFIPLKVTNIGVFRLDAKIKENRWILIDKNRFELMQYTGLKDKNGKEIYVGDIIRETENFNANYEVIYLADEGMFIGIKIGDRDLNSLSFPQLANYGEVIGNKFDNPELLEGESK